MHTYYFDFCGDQYNYSYVKTEAIGAIHGWYTTADTKVTFFRYQQLWNVTKGWLPTKIESIF